MKHVSRRHLCVFLTLMGLSLAVTAWAQTRPSSRETKIAEAKMVKEIRGYTRWVAVNSEPVEMEPRVAIACAPIRSFQGSPKPKPFLGKQGPHDKKWLNVFVNSIGEAAMMT